MITKENIAELLLKSGIKLLEYNGSLERGCSIQYPNGVIKILTRTDKLYYRHKKKLNKPHQEVSNEVNGFPIRKYKKLNYISGVSNAPKWEIFLKDKGYEVIEKNKGIFRLICKKHNKEFTIKRDNIGKSIKKGRSNPYFCPECKRNHLIEKINNLCNNVRIVKEIEYGDTSHRKFLFKCLDCNYEFERFSSDIIQQKATSCPNCKPYKDRPNPFFKSFDEYSECVRRLTKLNITRFSKYLKVSDGTNVHLDHKFSISDGYDNHLPPWMVSCPINLEYISGQENMEKHKKSSITLKELLSETNKFLEVEKEYLNLF